MKQEDFIIGPKFSSFSRAISGIVITAPTIGAAFQFPYPDKKHFGPRASPIHSVKHEHTCGQEISEKKEVNNVKQLTDRSILDDTMSRLELGQLEGDSNFDMNFKDKAN
jgi:hypothetical protein